VTLNSKDSYEPCNSFFIFLYIESKNK